MRSAATVLLAVLVLAAGCVGGGPLGGDSPTDAGGESEPDSTATPLPDETVEFPDGPKERPDRPDDLTESSVRSFVKTFEYRRVYNRLWYGENTDVNLECEVHSVEKRSTFFVAVVSCTGSSTTRGTASGNETATAMHADWFTQTFRYYVDEDSLIRERAENEGE